MKAKESQPKQASVQAPAYVRWFAEVGMQDVPSVGGKNASLGEMIQALKEEGGVAPCDYPEFAAFLMSEGIAQEENGAP